MRIFRFDARGVTRRQTIHLHNGFHLSFDPASFELDEPKQSKIHQGPLYSHKYFFNFWLIVKTYLHNNSINYFIKTCTMKVTVSKTDHLSKQNEYHYTNSQIVTEIGAFF